MRNAQAYLEIVKERGERRLELKRVYRNLQNRELFLSAYAKLYANRGALTPGIEPRDTADGMALKRIASIIVALETGTYQWKPVRRVYIPKSNGRKRPLGVPGWKDKLLQEVLRMVLAAYYEPQFSTTSHGFRAGRGCHTALQSIMYSWHGTKWYIEGDIKGCFDQISHEKLLEIMGRNLKDQRLLKLLREMLEAGYMEDWHYHQNYSGTPQGGILSPLLANVFLNELDKYVEEELIPRHNRGKQRRRNSEYERLTREMIKARKEGKIKQYKTLEQQRRRTPTGDHTDPGYRRLRYVRYADDFLLGFIGPRSEAEEIKQKIGIFLQGLGLTMSEEKTLITHAATERARFLGYEISIGRSDSRRAVNGVPRLSVPHEVAQQWKRRYLSEGKPRHRPELTEQSDYGIVMTYNMEFQGLVNYYVLAYDVGRKLRPVKWVGMQSLVRTIATKHKRSVPWVYQRYYRKSPQGVMAIVAQVARDGQEPLTASFGAKPIRREKLTVINDAKPPVLIRCNEIVQRLLKDECELCGSREAIEVHHIRKLKDLKDRYKGRNEAPVWVMKMVMIRRKTLVVCANCHRTIHAGKYDGPRLT